MFFIYAVFSGLIPVASTFFTKIVIDLIQGSGDVTSLIISVAVLISICIVSFVVSSTLGYYNGSIFLSLRMTEFEKIVKLMKNVNYECIEDSVFQDRINVGFRALGSDGRGFEHTYSSFVRILGYLVSCILFFVIIGYNEIYIALICIGVTIATAFINKTYSTYAHSREDDDSRTARQANYFNETCSDFDYGKDIRIFDLKDSLINKYKNRSLSYIKVVSDVANRKFLLSFGELVLLLLQDGFSYYLIIKGYFDGTLSMSLASLYLVELVSFSTILRSLVDEVSIILKDLKLSSTYYYIIDNENKLKSSGSLKAIAKDTTITIEFKHVYFKYPNTEKYILNDLNLVINAKEKIAIVGTNGAGKSTIVKLICGLFYPTKGEILINGIPTTSFDQDSYYDMFSTVFQDYSVYACSVLDNIIGNDSSEDAAIRAKQCIETIGLKDVIEKLPQKYDTVLNKTIDEKGVDLSGGQKQKIAIARALYKNGNVVILDEPTSALDALAEADIYQSFDGLIKDKTAIYISHRLSSTKFCDHIAFFNENGLKEYGTHEELMAKKGEYYKMFVIQGRYYQEEQEYGKN